MAVRECPVFLHTGWRTAGTWLWSAFRSHKNVMGFYEPFNQSLATLTLRTLSSMRPGASRSRHPGRQRPYFEEFAPLFSSRAPGVIGYRSEFAYDSFFMPADEKFPELGRYIESLLHLAHANEKTPVLKFCRSLGRVGWMRRNFPEAAHIFVMRDPCSQWMSAWRLSCEDDNPHHLLSPIRVWTLHHRHPLVARVIDALRIGPDDFMLPTKHADVRRAVRSIPPHTLYRGFLAFWLLTAFLAFPECDLAIETEHLSAADYRVAIQQSVESLTGIPIDLGDALPLAGATGSYDFFEPRHAHADALAALELDNTLGPILEEKLTQRMPTRSNVYA